MPKRQRPSGVRVPLIVLVALATTAALLPAGGAAAVPEYRDLDGSIIARNILPPGQGRYLNTAELALAQTLGQQPEMNTDQIDMYEDLIQAAPTLSDADVQALFKDNSFGVPEGEIEREYSPRDDVTVLRDSFDVPHVYGSTRSGTMFGVGYVSAEDRIFMMDTLRHLSRGRLSEFLGASDANLAADRAQRLVADYTEEELWHMSLRLLEVDEELAFLALQDLNAFAAGVNAYIQEMLVDPTKLPAEYAALQLVPKPWKLTDSVSLATLIGGTFSVGGGGQLRNDVFLDALEAEHDTATARAIFDDFRNADDPEAPVNTTDSFPLNADLPAPDPAAVARPDDPEEVSTQIDAAALPPVIDGPFGSIRLALPNAMSNALLVGPEKSATGNPIAVFGPQVGYYSPEILMEIDMHGPGIHARGAAFPGISLYVLLGRGTDYAWSATTAVGDHIDIRAVKLCEPDGSEPSIDSTHYLADGVCTAMYVRTDSWLAKPTAGGVPSSPTPDRIVVEMTTQRTHHGIVAARGAVDGEPVAFVRQRSSYFREVDATLTYTLIHDPARIDDIDDLLHAFGDFFSFSFNWHLITDTDVGFITTGRYPVLADGVDPDLPFWGDSEWDWERFLTFEEHPQSVFGPSTPSEQLDDAGFITNWNNKQAPGFRASDDNYSYGSVQRKMLLHDGVLAALEGDGVVTLTELTQAMGIAATQDLRGVKVLPLMLELIGAPEDPALAEAVATLSAWVEGGSHRRDLDGDLRYDEAEAVALMDALWSPALQGIFEPVLGSAFDRTPIGHSNQPGPGGSSFFGGWYSHASKDLRTLLGHPVTAPYSRLYCGGGSVAVCSEALTGALQTAVEQVAAAFGPDPDAAAAAQYARDAIRFSAVGVQGQRLMHWQNRPTWQQVLEFGTP